MEYDQCWKKEVCCLFSLLARCKDVFIPNCLPKALWPPKHRMWLWSRQDRHIPMSAGGAWTHSCPLSRFTGAQASARSYHSFAKGTRCQQRMWLPSRLSCSSHLRCSRFRKPFFFPQKNPLQQCQPLDYDAYLSSLHNCGFSQYCTSAV